MALYAATMAVRPVLDRRWNDAQGWDGVRLFTDWQELPLEETDVATVAQVELAASDRDRTGN